MFLGIRIKFKGAANTSWTIERTEKDSDGNNRTVSETVTGHEEYFKLEHYLLGSASGKYNEKFYYRQLLYTCLLKSELSYYS